MDIITISQNFQQLRTQIQLAEQRFQRLPGSVQLLAVSKQQSIEKIQFAIAAGQTHFGENYLQEALPKIIALKQLSLTWHFIGKIQANKTKLIAEHFDWVHSIDKFKIAQRLNEQRPKNLPALNVCIEVNISQESSKSGVRLEEIMTLAQQIIALQKLRLRGLMVIPAPSNGFDTQFAVYRQVQQVQQALCAQGLTLDTLSMGMSNDFIAAIAAGSTMVRIGTAIFGTR